MSDKPQMTAIVRSDDGRLSALQVARPVPGPTEVLFRSAAAGVNAIDWKIRATGDIFGTFDPDLPMVLGWDVAGEVVEVGPGVTRFAVGDRVFGMPRFPRPAEAYAEYVVAGSREVAHTPQALSDVEAAALPLAVLTAWQSVVDTLRVGQGDRVLVHAASGGVGHLAVQLAKARGAEVWATASARNHDALRDLGVDHVIDHRTELFEEVAVDMDGVLDLVGGAEHAERSVRSLRRGGRLVVVPSPDDIPSRDVLDEAGVSATWILVEPDYAALEAVAQMIGSGTLRVVVGDTRPLERLAELHEIGATGGPLGKLVATIG
ncbi:NADP-dependent oxidoreductase [Nocardioides dokdonensis]|nr:NADP-dependent oxidoreductase [Nocardioides dokdonensis]